MSKVLSIQKLENSYEVWKNEANDKEEIRPISFIVFYNNYYDPEDKDAVSVCCYYMRTNELFYLNDAIEQESHFNYPHNNWDDGDGSKPLEWLDHVIIEGNRRDGCPKEYAQAERDDRDKKQAVPRKYCQPAY
jgi:hypothetical protein